MDLYTDLSRASTRTHLMEAKRELIDLMAKEIAAQRFVCERKACIAQYEKYATEALDIEEQVLALEIAEKIVSLESGLELQEKTNYLFSTLVDRLKTEVLRLERFLYDPGDRLQYILDYLEAATDLEYGFADRELERKMQAAGIGKHVNAGRDVLERIRCSR